MNRPTVRGDLALMEGYHSAQVDVSVRLKRSLATSSIFMPGRRVKEARASAGESGLGILPALV